MNIQAEKIELIRRITEVESEAVIERLKAILMPRTRGKKAKEAHEAAMLQKVEEARAEIAAGKGVKIPLEDLWK